MQQLLPPGYADAGQRLAPAEVKSVAKARQVVNIEFNDAKDLAHPASPARLRQA